MPKLKAEKKRKTKEFYDPYCFTNAVKKGDIFTRLSMLVMGLGNLVRGQIVKGLSFLIIEAAYIVFMIMTGGKCLVDLFHLGGQQQIEVWNEAKQVYEYAQGDNSLLMLLFGVATLFVTISFIMLWRASVKSSYKAQCMKASGRKPDSFIQDIKSLFDKNLHRTLLTLPTLGVLSFTILPLVFMISMAFTNYSKIDSHLTIFNWVGLENFPKVFSFNSSIGKSFWGALGWTLIWAVFATFSNYILGMILAIIINRKNTRGKGFWRTIFMLSAAVPQFVSLLLMRTMFNREGIINTILQRDNAMLARIVIIVVNIWIGIPFTMLQVTGVLQNIPADLYEAAKVDGAGPVKTFFKITLPYMLFVTGPYLITTFTGNINNFNVIYLLTQDVYTTTNQAMASSQAKEVDLLVTWLFRLTQDYYNYKMASAIGIIVFIICAVFTLVAFNRMIKGDKEGTYQ